MANPALSQVTRGTDVDCLNDALDHLMLMPVENLDNMPGGSDAFWVYQRMIRVHRRLAAQGWYCYNRLHRYAPTYNVGLDRYTVPGALLARTALRLPSDPVWPETRLAFPVSGDPYLVRVDRSETSGSEVFELADRTILLDATFGLTISEAPEQYRSYLAIRTSEEMGAKFGVPVTAGASAAYLYELKLIEAAAEPKGNVFEDEYDTLATWAR